MLVYDHDWPQGLVNDYIVAGSIESVPELVAVLRHAHEDAKEAIAACRKAADDMEAGKYPKWLREWAEDYVAVDGEGAPDLAKELMGHCSRARRDHLEP